MTCCLVLERFRKIIDVVVASFLICLNQTIVQVLLALERIEQDEELSFEVVIIDHLC